MAARLKQKMKGGRGQNLGRISGRKPKYWWFNDGARTSEEPSASPRNRGAARAIPGAHWQDLLTGTIAIPQIMATRELSQLSASSRLHHVWHDHDLRHLGDLDGLSYAEILRWRNCGRGTVEELARVIKTVEREARQFGLNGDRPAANARK